MIVDLSVVFFVTVRVDSTLNKLPYLWILSVVKMAFLVT